MGKRYRQVQLTEDQMQCIANALALYFNWCTEHKVSNHPAFLGQLQSAMEEFKISMSGGIVLPFSGVEE